MPAPLGTVTLNLVDEARFEPLLGPAVRRPVAAQLIYPAAAPARPGPRIPERAGWFAAASHWPDKEPYILAELYGSLPAAGAENARPADGRYPLLLFSPGGYQSRHAYEALGRRLAEAGYVVALLSHAFGGLDMFPGHGLVGRHPGRPERTAGQSQHAHLAEMTDCLAADARFVLDSLLMGPAWLAAIIDPTRIAVLGHSRGGRTVSRAASTDPRIQAALIYDALPPEPERLTGFSQPLLLMRVADPEHDHHWREGLSRWPSDRTAAIGPLLAASRDAAYDLAISGIGHMNFSDRAGIEPNRFVSRISAERATRIIVSLTLAFLDRHLRGYTHADLAATAVHYPEVASTIKARSAD
jgi:dienelactone hydrolase